MPSVVARSSRRCDSATLARHQSFPEVENGSGWQKPVGSDYSVSSADAMESSFVRVPGCGDV